MVIYCEQTVRFTLLWDMGKTHLEMGIFMILTMHFIKVTSSLKTF